MEGVGRADGDLGGILFSKESRLSLAEREVRDPSWNGRGQSTAFASALPLLTSSLSSFPWLGKADGAEIVRGLLAGRPDARNQYAP